MDTDKEIKKAIVGFIIVAGYVILSLAIIKWFM